MEGASLRDRLHAYIDTADEGKLSAIYALLEEEFIYDKETISMLHERRNNHINGTSKSYTTQESLTIIRDKNK